MFKVLIDDFKMALSRRDNYVVLCLLIALGWFVFSNGIIVLISRLVGAPALVMLTTLNLNFPDVFIYFWNILFFPFDIKGIWAFLWSMMFLNMYGNILAEFIGGKKFLHVFLLSGYIAFAVFLLLKVFSTYIFKIGDLELVSSGIGFSVVGVLFAIMALSPTYETFVFSFKIKLIWIALFFIFFSCVNNPIYFIPFMASAATVHYYIKNMKGEWALSINFAKLFKKKEKKADFTVHRNTEKKEFSKKEFFPSQEEIDRILDKINNEGGFESLTSEEKERLKRASSMKE
jgi:membrane associated rhomboid family serine protease